MLAVVGLAGHLGGKLLFGRRWLIASLLPLVPMFHLDPMRRMGSSINDCFRYLQQSGR